MSLLPLATRPTHKVVPLLRSELSRISHRRLLRVLTLLFLGGIILVSAISFVTHRSTAGSTPEELERNRAQQQQFYDACSANQKRHCGADPSTQPLERYDYGENKQYRAKEMLPAAVLGVSIAAAGIAFIVGASSGGAEWSSRSMTLQLLWEPRRLRLLITKWVGLIAVMTAVTIVALALAVGLSALTATVRGSWDQGKLPSEFGDQSLWPALAPLAGRGLVLVAIAATIGYAIAILVRNTGASLGVAFVYFAVFETAVGLALMKYGPEPYLFRSNTAAFMLPGGLDLPGRRLDAAQIDPYAGGYLTVDTVQVHVSNARALLTMLVYTALVAVPAAWSFTRRDVG
ncbi:MAG TPA: ABC transporter permease subunit [Actinomycetes bacterium]|nr:ABC transporter permease subunit [Actinomycetes bacterium]